MTGNKFEVLSKLSSDEDTVENGIGVNTDDAEEEFCKPIDKYSGSVKDCFREFKEAQASSFEVLLRQQQQIKDFFQSDFEDG